MGAGGGAPYGPEHAQTPGDRVGPARPGRFARGAARRGAAPPGAPGRHGRRYAADHRRGARHGLRHGHGHLVGPARGRLGGGGFGARPLRGERADGRRHPHPGHEHHTHRAVRPAVRLRDRGGPARDPLPVPAGLPGRVVVPGQRVPGVQPLDRTATRRLPRGRGRTPRHLSRPVRPCARHRLQLPPSGTRQGRRDLPPRERQGCDHAAVCPYRRPRWTGSWPGRTRPAARTSRSARRPARPRSPATEGRGRSGPAAAGGRPAPGRRSGHG